MFRYSPKFNAFLSPPPPLSAEQHKNFDFLLFGIRHSLTESAFRDLNKTTLFKENGLNPPPPYKLKAEAWEYLERLGIQVSFFNLLFPCDLTRSIISSFSQVQNLAPIGKEPVPFFSISQCVRLWLLHPVLSEVICKVSEKSTKPHIPFLLENRENNHLPPGFPSSEKTHMSDGSLWLEPLRRTANYWEASWKQDSNILFLHLLLFGDGIVLWKNRQQSYEVLTTTLGEFDEGLRSSTRSPAIQINTILSKKLLGEHFSGSFDQVLDLFVDDLVELARGIPVFCHYQQKPCLVVAVFHGFEADLMFRSTLGGGKAIGNCHGQFCPCCPQSRDHIPESILSDHQANLRDREEYRTKIAEISQEPHPTIRDLALYGIGLSRISC